MPPFHKYHMVADIIEGIRKMKWGFPAYYWNLFELLGELETFPSIKKKSSNKT